MHATLSHNKPWHFLLHFLAVSIPWEYIGGCDNEDLTNFYTAFVLPFQIAVGGNFWYTNIFLIGWFNHEQFFSLHLSKSRMSFVGKSFTYSYISVLVLMLFYGYLHRYLQCLHQTFLKVLLESFVSFRSATHDAIQY